MTPHLTPDELVLHYYGETAHEDGPRVDRHLAECAACQAERETLRRVLTLVESAPPVEVRPGFERDVWARLEPQLDAPRAGWRDWFSVPRWALAGGVAAMVLAAFVAGRFSGASLPAAPVEPTAAALSGPPALEASGRVLRAAVGDHLDQSQIMLVELLNADPKERGQFAADQVRAGDLVAASRLYRQSATQSGDTAVTGILEDVERVLLEIANAPVDVTSKELNGLKARIAAQDLLFRVRVVASEMRQQTKTDRETGDRRTRQAPVS
jgi:hypothetical protein